jgi:hypothetical protein
MACRLAPTRSPIHPANLVAQNFPERDFPRRLSRSPSRARTRARSTKPEGRQIGVASPWGRGLRGSAAWSSRSSTSLCGLCSVRLFAQGVPAPRARTAAARAHPPVPKPKRRSPRARLLGSTSAASTSCRCRGRRHLRQPARSTELLEQLATASHVSGRGRTGHIIGSTRFRAVTSPPGGRLGRRPLDVDSDRELSERLVTGRRARSGPARLDRGRSPARCCTRETSGKEKPRARAARDELKRLPRERHCHARAERDRGHPRNPEVGLTDDVMAEMNPMIRRAICEALEILDNPDTYQAALAFTAMLIPEYWEAPSTLPPLGNLSLAGKEPPRVVRALDPRQVTVRVTVPTRGRSYFTCPNCGTQIKSARNRGNRLLTAETTCNERESTLKQDATSCRSRRQVRTPIRTRVCRRTGQLNRDRANARTRNCRVRRHVVSRLRTRLPTVSLSGIGRIHPRP